MRCVFFLVLMFSADKFTVKIFFYICLSLLGTDGFITLKKNWMAPIIGVYLISPTKGVAITRYMNGCDLQCVAQQDDEIAVMDDFIKFFTMHC